MPLIPVLGGQRQVALSEFEGRLVNKVSSRTTRDIQRNPVLKKTTKKFNKLYIQFCLPGNC